MRKVIVEVKVKLVVSVDEGYDIGHILDEMDYSFSDTTTRAEIEDTEIVDYEVKDSK